MNGRDYTAAFLPLDFKIGGQNKDGCPTVGQYLTRDPSQVCIQEGRSRGINKCRYGTTRYRSRKTIEQTG